MKKISIVLTTFCDTFTTNATRRTKILLRKYGLIVEDNKIWSVRVDFFLCEAQQLFKHVPDFTEIIDINKLIRELYLATPKKGFLMVFAGPLNIIFFPRAENICTMHIHPANEHLH